MRIRTLVLVASVAALSAAPAAAVGSHQVGLELGASVPSGDFGDAASTGFNVGGVYQYGLDRFGIGGEVKYHSWGASSATKATLGTGSEMKFSAMQYDVYGIMNLPMQSMPSVTPYLKLGGGWYAPATKITTPTGESSTSSSDFGIVGGLGFQISTHSSMKLGVGADYHRINNSDTDSNTDFMSFSARVLFPIH